MKDEKKKQQAARISREQPLLELLQKQGFAESAATKTVMKDLRRFSKAQGFKSTFRQREDLVEFLLQKIEGKERRWLSATDIGTDDIDAEAASEAESCDESEDEASDTGDRSDNEEEAACSDSGSDMETGGYDPSFKGNRQKRSSSDAELTVPDPKRHSVAVRERPQRNRKVIDRGAYVSGALDLE